MTQNLYEILGVEKGSDIQVIKKAYHKLAKQYHPDKNQSGGAKEKYNEIVDAYEYLSDAEKKKFYDEHGVRMDQEGMGHGFEGGHPFEQMFGFGGNPFGGHPFGAGGPFGGHPFGRGGQNQEQMMKEMQKKKLNINMSIELTLEEIYSGLKKKIKITRAKVENRKQTQFEDEIEINIPAGASSKNKIEIKDKGHVMILENNEKLTGTIYINVTEKPDKTYERDIKKPENLISKQEITFIQALCGFELILNHPSTKKLVIQYDDIIKDNKTYIVVDQGLPKQGTKNYGDLLIKFIIKFPQEITETQRLKITEIFNYNKKIHNIKEGSKYVTKTLCEHCEEDDESESEEQQQFQTHQQVQCQQS
jgi:DnaJ family protein B protein 4